MEIRKCFSKSISAGLRTLATIFLKSISTALYPGISTGYYRMREEPLVLSFPSFSKSYHLPLHLYHIKAAEIGLR